MQSSPYFPGVMYIFLLGFVPFPKHTIRVPRALGEHIICVHGSNAIEPEEVCKMSHGCHLSYMCVI